MTIKDETQDADIANFKRKYDNDITSKEIEEYMHEAAKLGKKLELSKIQTVVNESFMTKIKFSDPIVMQYMLPLLPEFIFYCSNPDSDSLDTIKPKKSIPIANFKEFLFKIIDNREADSIDDLLKEIVSLIFVLDEQYEGASACDNAMSFVHDLLKERSEIQYQVALGIRLMAILINSRFVPNSINSDFLNILNPGRFQEPFVRKNQYIAIRDLFSRAGNQDQDSHTDFRKIPYDFFTSHEKIKRLFQILLFNIKLKNSYQKLEKFNKLIKDKEGTENQDQSKKSKSEKKKEIVIKKWNNIIIKEENSKISKIYEFDQWVQCQIILLLPYMYDIKKNNIILGRMVEKNQNNIFHIENLQELSWNVQYCYLSMLRSSEELLNQSGELLVKLYYASEFNSDIQTALFLTIIQFFKNNENCLASSIYIKTFIEYQIKEKEEFDKEVKNFCKALIKNTKKCLNDVHKVINQSQSEDNVFKDNMNYILKVIPILTWILKYCFAVIKSSNDNENTDVNINYISNTVNSINFGTIISYMNQIPINGRPICCRLFLDPYFIAYFDFSDQITNKISAHIKQSFDIAQNALRILMNSKEDFDDRLFFIKIINKFHESDNQLFRKESISFIMPLIDLIANDPVYIVRCEAVQTVLNLLFESTFASVFDYIQQVFPGASLNGKKSLLSLIASIISSIDPFEKPEDKEELFDIYINDIFDVIGNNKNRDLRNFFKDILKNIWTLLPKNTQDLLQRMDI